MNCINFQPTSSSNFGANQETSIHSDALGYKNQISMRPGMYKLSNTYSCSGMDPINHLANNNIGFIAQDGFGTNPIHISQESQLQHSVHTNPNTVNQLFPRSVGSLPVMTKKMDLNADALIKSPEYSENSKSFITVTETDFDRFIPLVSHLRNSVQNPKYIIPENSARYWKQGGISTRDLHKNTKYLSLYRK